MDKVVAVICGALLAGCSFARGPENGLARIGELAPGWTARTTSGQELSLASLRGKAVYLNFFATWCQPCNEEAPYINALQKKFAARGLRVVGVDELESAQKAEGFRKKYGLVYPAVIDTGSFQDRYPINGLPVHVFIARDGTVRRIVEGEMSSTQIAAAISVLLAR